MRPQLCRKRQDRPVSTLVAKRDAPELQFCHRLELGRRLCDLPELLTSVPGQVDDIGGSDRGPYPSDTSGQHGPNPDRRPFGRVRLVCAERQGGEALPKTGREHAELSLGVRP